LHSYQVDSHPLLTVNGKAGSIHVHAVPIEPAGADSSAGTIVISSTMVDSFLSSAPPVTFSSPDHEHVTITVGDTVLNPMGSSMVNFEIAVPTNIDLALQTRGDIEIDGVSGSVQARAGLGDITLTNTSLQGSGYLRADTTGSISVSGTMEPGAHYWAESNLGPISLLLPGGSRIHFDASTKLGIISSDLTAVVAATQSRGAGAEAHVDIGDTGSAQGEQAVATMTLTSNVGSISIRGAPSR
jgi:hypothetical protein